MTEATGVPIVVAQPAIAAVPIKSGWKTTEFYFSKAAVLLSILFAADVIPTSGPYAKVAAIAAMILISQGYAVSRSIVKAATVLLVLALMPPQLGCSASAREKTISATFSAVDSASSAFVAFDLKHQQDIVAQATDPGSGQALITEWRKRRQPAEAAFVIAYRAIAVAARTNDDTSLHAMIDAAAIVVGALRELGVKL